QIQFTRDQDERLPERRDREGTHRSNQTNEVDRGQEEGVDRGEHDHRHDDRGDESAEAAQENPPKAAQPAQGVFSHSSVHARDARGRLSVIFASWAARSWTLPAVAPSKGSDRSPRLITRTRWA